MSSPLVYEVTLDIQADAAVEFDAWLKDHVRAMLALPGFHDARILKPDGAEPGTEQAGLRLEIVKHWREVREDHGVTVAGRCDWTRYEVRAPVPEDADIIRFGITLTGAGRIGLRHPELSLVDVAR